MIINERPLEGVKVLDFTRVYAGPYCTMMLADLGAEIVKIERPNDGDDTRQFLPLKNNESGYFMYLNRNKKSIILDLKDKKSKKVIEDLTKWADIVVENFAPGVASKLGIDYETLQVINPQIIYGSISGFGQYGPYSRKVCYDAIAQAMSGMMSITGFSDGPPTRVASSIGDSNAGIHMAYAIVSALYYREKSGEGQYIDVAMHDSLISIMENFIPTQTMMDETPLRNGNVNLAVAPFNTYETKNGHVFIAIANDAIFKRFCIAISNESLLNDSKYSTNAKRKRNQHYLDEVITGWTTTRTREEVNKVLDNHRVPVGSILTVKDIVQDDHVKARDMLVNIEHPNVGCVKYPGNPLKFSKTKVDKFKRAPLLGEHTNEILKEKLNYTEEEIKSLMG